MKERTLLNQQSGNLGVSPRSDYKYNIYLGQIIISFNLFPQGNNASSTFLRALCEDQVR